MNQDTLITKFVAEGATKGKASHLLIRDDVLYSYGTHFPLLVRMPWGFLQNADKYSVTTSCHQSATAVFANALIPFSALERAGIDYRDIDLVDKAEQVWEDREYVNEKGERVTVTERRPEALLIAAKREITRKQAYFLASMDNGHYFLSLLPKACKTVSEAFDALRPEGLQGKVEGKDYLRQGEWFFLPTEAKGIPSSLVKHSKALPNRFEGQEPHHYATEAVRTEKGYLVRGTVRHSRHDHPMLKLGKRWYLAVESRHLRSWGASGRID